MFSSEDHPAVFTFMVGMIVLVMAGVGLSLLVDRRFQFSGNAGELKQELEYDETAIQTLKIEHEARSKVLYAKEANKKAALALDELSAHSAKLNKQLKALSRERDDARGSLAVLETSYSNCRLEYRRKVWMNAVGEDLGDLEIRGGRKYLQASIKQVTDVGLEIRHADGIARIQGPDLPPTFQDRFQWSDKDRETRLGEENAAQNGDKSEESDVVVSKEGAIAIKPSASVLISKSDNGPEQLSKRRSQVSIWQSKVTILANNHIEARSRSSSGQTSVPGTLETWKTRAARLEKDLVKARAELLFAKSKLAEIAPQDPLLFTIADQP